MMEEKKFFFFFLTKKDQEVYGTTKHNEFFGEAQWHFSTKFPLKLVMQWC